MRAVRATALGLAFRCRANRRASWRRPIPRLDRRSLFVESALLDNKPCRTLDGCAASDPGIGKWRGLGAAPQTRPKSRRLRSRGGRKKLNVSRPCRANGADGSAINAGTADPGEKPTVIARITRDARARSHSAKSSDITINFRKTQRHHHQPYHATGTFPERHQGMESRPGEQRSSALAISERETARRHGRGVQVGEDPNSRCWRGKPRM